MMDPAKQLLARVRDNANPRDWHFGLRATEVAEILEQVIYERDEARRARDIWHARADELRQRCDHHYAARRAGR